MKKTFRTPVWRNVALGALAGMTAYAAAPAAAQTKLLVYTAVEADELKKFKRVFEADNPDISIRWVRNSTGIVTATTDHAESAATEAMSGGALLWRDCGGAAGGRCDGHGVGGNRGAAAVAWESRGTGVQPFDRGGDRRRTAPPDRQTQGAAASGAGGCQRLAQ